MAMSMMVSLNPLRMPLAEGNLRFRSSPMTCGQLAKKVFDQTGQGKATLFFNPEGICCVSLGHKAGEYIGDTDQISWQLASQSRVTEMSFTGVDEKVLSRVFQVLNRHNPQKARAILAEMEVAVELTPTLVHPIFNRVKIAPSILSADFNILGQQIARLTRAGADLLHFDAMDAHFVPNLSFGLPILKSISQTSIRSKLPFDAHLMISDPLLFAEQFADAGAGIISFHVEKVTDQDHDPDLRSDAEIREIIQRIAGKGVLPALVLNPRTPVEFVGPYLSDIGMVLLMTVWPGYGGQNFIENDQISSLARIRQLRVMIDANPSLRVALEVDGGINEKTAQQCREAGADVLVSGSTIFGADDWVGMIKQLRGEE